MAGLVELLLGKSNPITGFVNENQNKIRGAFAGFGAEPGFNQSLSNAALGAAQGGPLDQIAAEKRQTIQQEAEAKNKTVAYLRAQPGGQQFADAIERGGMDGATAFKSWLDASKAQQPIEINGQLVDPTTMQVLGDFRTPDSGGGGNKPASVQEYEYAVSQGYDKPYQTFLQEKGRNAGTPPATIAKEIFEADEGAQAGQNVIAALDKALELNATAWDGPMADLGSSGAALLGNQEAVQTQELKNIVTANALESLKATFGAAPTEGERKILLEVQGSINQPRAVREAIFKRARAAAERRLKFNQERAGALRNDEYFAPGYSPVGGATGGSNDDVDAILTGLGL